MTCSSATEIFSEYFDGGLSSEERRVLEDHLQACSPCGAEYKTFTASLEALHETRPLETTRFFAADLKASARAYLRETGRIPPAGPSRPSRLPLAVAAALLAGFGLGYLIRGVSRDPAIAGPRRDIEDPRREPPAPPIPPPSRPVPGPAPVVDRDKLLGEKGLVRHGDRWIDARMKEDFDKDIVYYRGRRMTLEEAARELAAPAPLPPRLEAQLEERGHVALGNRIVPKDWLERWERGEVLVGVDRWRKPEEFLEDFKRRHGLVERDGKVMAEEQWKAHEAQSFVLRPDTATATNQVTRLLEGLKIGCPASFRGVTLYPLLAAESPKGAAPLTLHAALESADKFKILDTGLFAAQVRNMLDQDVLLVAGEILMGGRCARVVAQDTLVPRRKTVSAPVLCVEPATWKAADRFAKESGHFVAPPWLRHALVWDLGQGAIWSILSRRVDRERPGQVELYCTHVDALAECRAYFVELPDREPLATGVAVAIGDAIDHVEIYATPALFREHFDRLAAAAAFEILERLGHPAARSAPAVPNAVLGVKQFLEGAFFASYETLKDGLVVRKDDVWRGKACIAPAGVYHVFLSASGPPEAARRAFPGLPKDKLVKAIAEYERRAKDRESGSLLKIAALRDLGSLGAAETFPVLIGHLADTDLDVRRAAVREIELSGDPRAGAELLNVLARSRRDPLFKDVVQALCRMGYERAADPLLKHVDGGDPELARLAVQALPELLLQVRAREPLEKAITSLVLAYDATEPTDRVLAEAVRTALRQVTGIDHDRASGYRLWWSDSSSRERFLRERTGR